MKRESADPGVSSRTFSTRHICRSAAGVSTSRVRLPSRQAKTSEAATSAICDRSRTPPSPSAAGGLPPQAVGLLSQSSEYTLALASASEYISPSSASRPTETRYARLFAYVILKPPVAMSIATHAATATACSSTTSRGREASSDTWAANARLGRLRSLGRPPAASASPSDLAAPSAADPPAALWAASLCPTASFFLAAVPLLTQDSSSSLTDPRSARRRRLAAQAQASSTATTSQTTSESCQRVSTRISCGGGSGG